MDIAELKKEIIEEIIENLWIDIDEEFERDYGRSYTVINIKLMYGDRTKPLSQQSFTIDK